MRRLLKFLPTLGAAGMMGAMACLIVLILYEPPTSSLPEYALIRAAMANIAVWVFCPSLILTLIPGLLAIAWNPVYQNAGWVWAKAATGMLILEAGLVYVEGPFKEEAARAASALAGRLDPAELTGAYGAERNSMFVLLLVCLANVVLGVWRPRMARKPDAPRPSDSAAKAP